MPLPDPNAVAPEPLAEEVTPSKYEYWAKTATEALGEKLVTKVRDYGNSEFTSGMHTRNSRAYQYYFGMDINGIHATSQVTRKGEQGELAAMRVNHARSLVNTLLNLITAPKIVWVPKATNGDYDSVRECDLANAILEYYWQDRKVSANAVRALEEAIVMTEGYVFLYWDGEGGEDYIPDTSGKMLKTGDICIENVPTWDIIRDGNKTSWEALDWVIVRLYKNKYNLSAQYPQYEELIHQAQDEELFRPRRSTQQESDTDDIPCYYFYHKRTPALPDGREVLFLNNKAVLKDGPLSSETIPLYRVSAGELFGTAYGYSPFLEVLGIQELMDSLHTAVATNQSSLATQCIAVPEGTQFAPDSIAGGMRIVYYPPMGEPPRPLQLTASPPEVFKYLDMLKKDQELLFGLNSVVRGEPQSGEQSGSALAQLSSQALQQSSAIQASYLRFVESVGTGVLDMIRKNLAVQRQISIVGKSSEFLVTDAAYSGGDITRIKKVSVEIGSPLSQTGTGRQEMAKQLMANQLVKTPEQYLQVLNTGRLEPLTKGITDELLLIRGENEALARGEDVQVLILDDHMMHVREHRSVLANMQARKNEKLVQAALTHMAEHERIYFSAPPTTLQIMGQMPPMMQMPAGPPPGEKQEKAPGKPQGNPNSGAAPAELPKMPMNKQTGARQPPPPNAPPQ